MPLDARNQIAVLRDEKPLSLEKTMEETMTVEPHMHQGIVLHTSNMSNILVDQGSSDM